MRRADEHARDLDKQLHEAQCQLNSFCAHTHEPAMANANAKACHVSCMFIFGPWCSVLFA